MTHAGAIGSVVLLCTRQNSPGERGRKRVNAEPHLVLPSAPVVEDDVLVFERDRGGQEFVDRANDSLLIQVSPWIVVLPNDKNARMVSLCLHG